MNNYIVLLRGINVGGKNKMSMADLKRHLEDLGCGNVRTYINSGNVLLDSDSGPAELGRQIEDMLAENFTADGVGVRVLVLTHDQLEACCRETERLRGRAGQISQRRDLPDGHHGIGGIVGVQPSRGRGQGLAGTGRDLFTALKLEAHEKSVEQGHERPGLQIHDNTQLEDNHETA